MDIKVLCEFLNFPLESSQKIFEKFLNLPGAVFRGEGLQRFLYIKGKRQNKVLLVAHADTYWDRNYDRDQGISQDLQIYGNTIINKNGGLGADDRAGCAIIWLLKDLGHSILITDGEEKRQQGSNWLMDNNPDIADEINKKHQFIIQFDRKNSNEFKCYDKGTEEFRKYIIQITSFTEPDKRAATDIKALCRDIAGVNLSVGYYNEHNSNEYLNIDHWQNTLELSRTWLSEKELPGFPL